MKGFDKRFWIYPTMVSVGAASLHAADVNARPPHEHIEMTVTTSGTGSALVGSHLTWGTTLPSSRST